MKIKMTTCHLCLKKNEKKNKEDMLTIIYSLDRSREY